MSQSDIHRYLKHGTLPQLRVFEASVRLGTFARAAEELHMAAPTASVQLKKLAETVGVPLFEQVGRNVYPTEAGRRLYERCNEVFRAIAAFEESLADLRGLDVGRLRLAATTTARYFAPRLLAAFAQRHPALETALHVDNEAALMERLAANADDLYLLADPPRGGRLLAQAILPNPLVVFAREDHPLAHARRIPFARLAEEPFLVREEGSGTRNAVLALFARRRMPLKVRMELGSNEAIREAILAGVGVSILARYTLGAEPEPPGLACLDVEGFPLESQWHFAYPVGKHLSACARGFLDFTRAEARNLAHEAFAARAH